MILPHHINLTIEHQPHACYYESVDRWLADDDRVSTLPGDEAEIRRTGELWVIQWYPQTPVGFNAVAAATLERALELALATETTPPANPADSPDNYRTSGEAPGAPNLRDG